MKGRRLQVRIGSCIENLEIANVNDDSDPHYIDSPYFTGHILVRIKNFDGVTPDGGPSKGSEAYFDQKKRLFALQVSGRFKHVRKWEVNVKEYTADDIVFGSQFEKKCTPPFGTSVAMRFANLIDPALITDVFAESPWIFSPLLCSMNTINVVQSSKLLTNVAPSVKMDSRKNPCLDKSSEKESSNDKDLDALILNSPDPKYKPDLSLFTSKPCSKLVPLNLDTSMLEPWSWAAGMKEENTKLLQGSHVEFATDSWSERRKHFQKAKVRKSTVINPDHIYNLEV